MLDAGAASGFNMGNPSGIISRNLPIRIAVQSIDKTGLPPRLRNSGLYFILAKTVHPVMIGAAVPFDRRQDRVRDSLRGSSRYGQREGPRQAQRLQRPPQRLGRGNRGARDRGLC
jgi:hypothetical protein